MISEELKELLEIANDKSLTDAVNAMEEELDNTKRALIAANEKLDAKTSNKEKALAKQVAELEDQLKDAEELNSQMQADNDDLRKVNATERKRPVFKEDGKNYEVVASKFKWKKKSVTAAEVAADATLRKEIIAAYTKDGEFSNTGVIRLLKI